MLYNKDLKVTGSAFSVSKEFVKGLMNKDMEWDTDSLADLILYDGMDDPFDVKCYEWVISQTTMMQQNGCLENFLFDVRGCCMNLIEKSELLCECSSDEVPVLLDRITMIIEHMGYVKTALSTIAENKEKEYVTELFNKLKTSGFLYHPTKQFCVTTYLFRIRPDLMSGMIEELFNVIRTKDLSHWKKEPFRSELIKQLDTYIKSNDQETTKQPDKNELFYKGFQALAIQLLLANEDEDLIDVPLSRSMMCRYASHMKFANKKRMADMSLKSLLSLFKSRLKYGLSDTGTPDKFYYYMDNWGRNQDVDRSKCAVYRSKELVLSIQDGRITIAPDLKVDLKSALYDDVPLWKGMDVLLEKKYAQPPYKSKGSDLMQLNEKLWKKVEENLFETKRVIVKKEVKTRTIPEVGEWVLAYVYKQNEEDGNVFHCRIADDEKGFFGEGLISVRGEEGEPGIVTYFPDPTIDNFMDENGLPHLLEMVVVDKTEDDVCIMDMKQVITKSLEKDKPNFQLHCEVGKVLTGSTLLAVSNEGYSVFVTYEDTGLVAGDHIEVLLKDGRRWFQNGFLQADYQKLSEEAFTLNDAFGNLINEFSSGSYETVVDESANEVNLEKSHVVEILNIIDLVASVEDDIHVSYNYLGFASVLSRMIGNDDRARYYKGQMAVAQMLHKFAVTNDVDDEKLHEIQSVNKDLLSSNYNLRHQFYKLYAVSLMGEENNDWLKVMTEENTDENLRKLASLVYSYNVLVKAGIDATEVKKAIKDLLKLKGRDAYFKTYTMEEGTDVEFKTSIVYPPNAMKPDIEKQTFNIMKELCAFLNHKGGVLYLGVNDQGGGQGLEEDMKHENFRDSRDKYDNYVRNQIVAHLGQEASHCIEGHFDDDARGRDIYILTINPCEHPVKLAGNYYQRQGSSSRKVDKVYLQTFLKNRATEYRQLMKERGIEVVDPVITLSTETEVKTPMTSAAPAPKVRTIATSKLRNNLLHNYEDGYEYAEAYIHLKANHKYMMEKVDSYQESNYMLTLAVHHNEIDGYLLLVYDDATACKVPMSRILDKEVAKEYSRYNGAQVVFACPVRNNDVLYQTYEYKGETHHRIQDVADIVETNIGDPGSLLFDVDFDALINSEIIPAEIKDELPKRINDRRRIGYNTAKKDGAKLYAVLQKLGLL
jgi:hypothetical protein